MTASEPILSSLSITTHTRANFSFGTPALLRGERRVCVCVCALCSLLSLSSLVKMRARGPFERDGDVEDLAGVDADADEVRAEAEALEEARDGREQLELARDGGLACPRRTVSRYVRFANRLVSRVSSFQWPVFWTVDRSNALEHRVLWLSSTLSRSSPATTHQSPTRSQNPERRTLNRWKPRRRCPCSTGSARACGRAAWSRSASTAGSSTT